MEVVVVEEVVVVAFMSVEPESRPQLPAAHPRHVEDVLSVELEAVVGYLTTEVLDSVFPLRRNHQRHTVGQRPVLKLKKRGEASCRRRGDRQPRSLYGRQPNGGAW